MSLRCVSLLFVATAIGALAALPAAGQGLSDNWVPQRLSDGHPDLQGVWDFRTATPLDGRPPSPTARR